MKIIGVVLAAFMSLLTQPAKADLKRYLYERHIHRQHEMLGFSALTTIETGEFDQKIDPTNAADTRTFKQKYFFDSTYAAGPNSPVLYIICGEAKCTEDNMGGAAEAYAREFKTYRVSLEHRYYGGSQPFPAMTTENMKYLSTENAIADLATFQKSITQTKGLHGKWIVMGGSYSGSLSAYYRLKHPNLVVGSLASSAPVHAVANFEAYDLDVATVAGPACAAAMRKVVAQVEAGLSDPAQLAKYKALFDATAVKSDIDFLYVIADMGAMSIQYGFEDQFCSRLLAGDPLQGYATAGKQIFDLFGTTAVEDSFQGASSENPADYMSSFGARAWLYQSCTEYGYWQVAYHDPAVSVRSAKIDLAYHNETCKKFFGLAPVDTNHINQNLYEPLLTAPASEILFTNGSTDPWSKLSLSKALGNDTNPAFTFYQIEGGSHCSDLSVDSGSDSDSLKHARALFEQLVTGWLK